MKISKQKRKNKNQLYAFLMVVTLVLSIFMSMYSIMLVTTGYSNFDRGHGMRWIEERYNITLFDIASDGNSYDGSQLIAIGLAQMRAGLFLSMVFLFMLGWYVFHYELLLRLSLKNDKLPNKKS